MNSVAGRAAEGPKIFRMTEERSQFILALDTAQEECAAALCAADGTLLAQRIERVGNKHAERLLTLVGDVLAEAGVRKTDVGLVAFGAGPGGFTGLRVACGVAQGLAWALGVKTAPVANTEAAARDYALRAKLSAGVRIAVANDARMAECYAAVYETTEAGSLKEIAAPVLVKPEEAIAFARDAGARVLIGTGPSAYPEAFEKADGLRIDVVPMSSPAAIGRIASEMLAAGKTVEPAAAAPLYVRNRVALTMAERAAGERL